jgi:hypothetical protein
MTMPQQQALAFFHAKNRCEMVAAAKELAA